MGDSVNRPVGMQWIIKSRHEIRTPHVQWLLKCKSIFITYHSLFIVAENQDTKYQHEELVFRITSLRHSVASIVRAAIKVDSTQLLIGRGVRVRLLRACASNVYHVSASQESKLSIMT